MADSGSPANSQHFGATHTADQRLGAEHDVGVRPLDDVEGASERAVASRAELKGS